MQIYLEESGLLRIEIFYPPIFSGETEEDDENPLPE
jgi:hypothetical protein